MTLTCYFQKTTDLVLSHLGLAFVLMLRPFFPELVMSMDLLSFEHPSVLLFCFVHLTFFSKNSMVISIEKILMNYKIRRTSACH